MSRKLLISWCLLPFLTLISLNIHAQEEQVSVAGYYRYHNRQLNFSLHPWLSGGYVSLFSENQFLMKELCTATVSGSYNIKEHAVAINISHFGYSKYGIFTISSGYAQLFAKRVSFGLQVHYLVHHAETYPKTHSFTFDLSLYSKLSQKIGLGVSAYNPANLKYGVSGKEKIPMHYIIMLDYKLSDKVLLAVAASKQLPGFFDIAATLCFKDKFYGFMTDVSLKKVNLKCSFWVKKLQFDVGGSFDYRLGFSPQIHITYNYKLAHR
jgi:hypothetical protein